MSIDPSSLSLPSPRASPAPSASPTLSAQPGPSRKRPRTDSSPEDRKEARAHRNRIAAQNSRDKRKAQFSYLERRVAELEEENRQLRAGLASVTTAAPSPPLPSPVDTPSARDKENEELRERIRTLEKGWDAVVKALAAQGLPTGLPTPQTSASASPPPPSTDSSSSASHTTTAFPVLIPPPVSIPVSPAPSTGGDHRLAFGVPAAGGFPTTSQHALETASHTAPSSPDIDDVAMEALFREILAPSPSLPSTSLPPDTSSPSIPLSPTSMASATSSLTNPSSVGWAYADEVQRLLDMLPTVQADAQREADESFQSLPDIDLDLGGSGWELDNWASATSIIGVF